MFDESDPTPATVGQRSPALDALAASQHVAPTTSLDDLAVDVWESDVELDAFLDDVRTSGHADVA